MRRAGLVGLLGLALTGSCWDPSPAQTPSTDAAWAACTKAPKRACVPTIDQAVHVAGTIQTEGWRPGALRDIVKRLCSIAEALHE